MSTGFIPVAMVGIEGDTPRRHTWINPGEGPVACMVSPRGTPYLDRVLHVFDTLAEARDWANEHAPDGADPATPVKVDYELDADGNPVISKYHI